MRYVENVMPRNLCRSLAAAITELVNQFTVENYREIAGISISGTDNENELKIEILVKVWE